jgi:hypothetical protein
VLKHTITGIKYSNHHNHHNALKPLILNEKRKTTPAIKNLRKLLDLPFHGGDRGSNPLGDASKFKELA